MNQFVVGVHNQDHSKSMFEDLRSFALYERFTDICFVCAQGKKVFTHKLLLCSVSDIMKKMILEMPINNEIITIHVPDLRAKSVKRVVDFLYTGSAHLSRTEYEDFQDIMNTLGIVLTAGDNSEQPQPEQPPALMQVPIAQQPVYQPGTILVPNQQNIIPNHQPAVVNQVQAESSPVSPQFVVVAPNQNQQGIPQYILPEHAQFSSVTVDQSTSNMIPVQDRIQSIPVNSQVARSSRQAQTSVISNQNVRSRQPNTNNSIQFVSNTAQYQNTRENRTILRNNQMVRTGISQQANVQQSIMPRSNTNATSAMPAQGQIVRRRRKQDLQPSPGASQMKRLRDST